MLSMGSAAYEGNCVLDGATAGWTGKIFFHCEEDINLVDNPIFFELTNSVVVSLA